VKRQHLVAKVTDAARAAGLPWCLHRQGANHEIWQLGRIRIAIPRHRELKEPTALAILRTLESELGKDWWR
jgi:hypothetical protein